MSLKIYNTLKRKKEDFKPLKAPLVTMYVCGVTVYDECHLGHARALVNFDVIYRYLKYSGYQVKFARNFTDVDDKIIARGLKENIPWDQIAGRYIETFHRDANALGLAKPDVEPKATEHIADMLALIGALEKKGFAYKAGSDTFYAVRQKKDYGKLSGKKIDELESGSRVEIHEDKKDPLDFALWKAHKPGEPYWDSPWGQGRPGWHLECSAMSMKYLGETIDIHGGGRDLQFPHHENEIAQSEAATGKPFARYWVHNGFVNINAEKMSKSIGNIFTIRELLEHFPAEVLRLFIVAAQYRSPLDYTGDAMESAAQSLTRWYTTVARVQAECGKKNSNGNKAEKTLAEKIAKLEAEFRAAMDDDFNTAKVVGNLFDLAREWNRLLDTEGRASENLCRNFLAAVGKIYQVLGVFGADPEAFLKTQSAKAMQAVTLDAATIEGLITQRNEARKTKNFSRADEIRNQLDAAGIALKDNPDGTTAWAAKT